MGPSGQQWDLYVSYDPGVEDRARPVLDLLRAHHVTVCPEQVLPPARSTGKLGEAIRACAVLVVVLTRETAGGGWVRLDLELARILGRPVLAILLDPPDDVELPSTVPSAQCVYWSPDDPDATTDVGRALGELTGGAIGSVPCDAGGEAPRVTPTSLDDPRDKRPYLFVSYSHADRKVVHADLGLLDRMGYRIWYDEGIAGGRAWAKALARAIREARWFLLFLSPRSVESDNVLDEIYHAKNHKVKIIPVLLEPTELSEEHELLLVRYHRIQKHLLEPQEYMAGLSRALRDDGEGEEAAPEPPPVPEPGRAALRVSYLLTYSLDEGRSWRPIDVSRQVAAVPAGALLRGMVRAPSPCHVALLVISDDPDGAETRTTIRFAEPKDTLGSGTGWRAIEAMSWHQVPQDHALREEDPRIRRWRVGILVRAPGGEGGAQEDAPAEVLPRDPQTAIATAQRAAEVRPSGRGGMGRLLRELHQIAASTVPVAVLRGDDALTCWTEVRFQ